MAQRRQVRKNKYNSLQNQHETNLVAEQLKRHFEIYLYYSIHIYNYMQTEVPRETSKTMYLSISVCFILFQ